MTAQLVCVGELCCCSGSLEECACCSNGHARCRWCAARLILIDWDTGERLLGLAPPPAPTPLQSTSD